MDTDFTEQKQTPAIAPANYQCYSVELAARQVCVHLRPSVVSVLFIIFNCRI